MRNTLTVLFALAASPALAASEYGFFSLKNTDFIVLCAFILFIGILLYFKVPGTLSKMLDDRASGIQKELDEAKADEYRRRLAESPELQVELHAAVQLDVLASQLAEADDSHEDVVPIRPARRWLRAALPVAAAMLAGWLM